VLGPFTVHFTVHCAVIISNGAVNSEVNLSMYRDDGRVTAETCVG
jgi:hypothetical protein